MLDKETKQLLKTLESGEALIQLLSNTDAGELTQRDVDVISRTHRKLTENSSAKPDCKIAYLGNHTIEPLDRFVDVACLCHGISVASYLGEYDQHFQEILQSDSGCRIFQPDIIFLDLSLKVLAPEICDSLLNLSNVQRQAEQDSILSIVLDWIDLAKQQTDAVLVVSNFSRPALSQAGVADVKLGFGEAEFYHNLNMQLQRTYLDDVRVNIFDMDHVLACAGKLEIQDPKLYYLAKMEWTEQALTVIANMLLRYVIAIQGRAKKCLVLDLDNTLWGGIVGEDGIDGLDIGKGSPAGEAFYDFQRYIRVLKERGVILTICSKNNRSDAEEVFSRRDGMALELNDFSATQINWQHKHVNIQAIANDLNIGTDSIVFVDDNPVECELVRQMLPEVTTLELSNDPSLYVSQLKNLACFEKVTITDEDRQKTEQYLQNSKRAALKSEISDLSSFYESLGTEMTISVADDRHKARIHQLFSKTNQFNLTTIRYSLSEVEQFIGEQRWDLYIINVKDSFGDLGIVGLYLIDMHFDTPKIDSFILSCRAMGRGIETAMMNKIKQDYLMKGGFKNVSAVFYPTAKNKPVADYYSSEGFDIVEESTSDSLTEKKYNLSRQRFQLRDCAGITIRSV